MGVTPDPLHPGLGNSLDDNLTWLDRRLIYTEDYVLLNVPLWRRGE